jgi:hypothetical protein
MVVCDTAGFVQTAPSSWLQGPISSFNRNVLIWYYPNNAGGLSSFAFVTSGGGGIAAVVLELQPGTIDVQANGAASNGATITAIVAAALANGFAVTMFAKGAASETFTLPGGGWTSALFQNSGNLSATSAEADYNVTPGSGTVSELMTSSGTTTSWDWVIAVFKFSPTVQVPVFPRISGLN